MGTRGVSVVGADVGAGTSERHVGAAFGAIASNVVAGFQQHPAAATTVMPSSSARAPSLSARGKDVVPVGSSWTTVERRPVLYARRTRRRQRGKACAVQVGQLTRRGIHCQVRVLRQKGQGGGGGRGSRQRLGSGRHGCVHTFAALPPSGAG